jgi:TPR repeat protein
MAELQRLEADCQRLIALCQSARPNSPAWIENRSFLANAMQARENYLEDTRVAMLVKDHSVSCSKCQSSLGETSSWQDCCGMPVCGGCQRDSVSGCPICEANSSKDTTTSKKRQEFLNDCIQNGDDDAIAASWAHYSLGRITARNPARSIDHMQQAASKGHAAARYLLGVAAASGANLFADLDETHAKHHFEQAAKQGYPDAQYQRGLLYLDENVTEERMEQGIRWMTLAAAQHHAKAQSVLAAVSINAFGKFPQKPNVERSLYWAKKGAGQNEAYCQLLAAQCCIILAKQTFGGNLNITGYSPIPQIVYWLRKSSNGDNKEAKQMLMTILQKTRQTCAQCHGQPGNTQTPCTKLVCCGRCQCVYYCGKACSKVHWKQGHKKDCVEMPKPILAKKKPVEQDDEDALSTISGETLATSTTISTSFTTLDVDSWFDLLN